MVEDVNKRNRVMESIHNSSHLGINRTLDLVFSNVTGQELTNDVKQYVSTTRTNTTYLACVCTCMCHVSDHNLNIFFRFTRVMYIKNQSQATEGSRFSKANSSSIKDMVSSEHGFDWPIA